LLCPSLSVEPSFQGLLGRTRRRCT
jgi:hypothetical protein